MFGDRQWGSPRSVAEAQGDAVYDVPWRDRFGARGLSTGQHQSRRKPQLSTVLDGPEVLRDRRGYQQAVPVVDCGGENGEVGRERNREEELALLAVEVCKGAHGRQEGVHAVAWEAALKSGAGKVFQQRHGGRSLGSNVLQTAREEAEVAEDRIESD